MPTKTKEQEQLICPVCKEDYWNYLRCYRPDCTDGRAWLKKSK